MPVIIKIGVDDKGNAKIVELNKNVDKLKGKASDLGPIVKKAFAFAGVVFGLQQFSGALRSSVDEILKFDQAMARIKGIGGIVGDSLARTNKLARDLAKNTEFSASQTANAMLEVVKMGFKADELKNVMPTILDLASASMMELNYAAENTISTMNQFGMSKSLDEVKRTANVIATTLNATGAGAEDFMESMKYAGAVAKATGMSFEETSAMMGVLADAGIKGSQAGTTLRQMFLSLMDPTDAVRAGLEKLDIKGKTLSEVLMGLRKNGLGVIDFLKQFDQRAVTGALRLADPDAVEKLKGLNIALLEQAINVKDVSDMVRDNLMVDLKQLVNHLNEVGLSIFDAFGNRPKTAIEGVIKAVDSLDSWVDQNQESIGKLADAVAKGVKAFADLTSVLGPALLGNLDKLVGLFALMQLRHLPGLMRSFSDLTLKHFPGLITSMDKTYTTSYKVKDNFAWIEKAPIPGAVNAWTTSFEGMVTAMYAGVLAGTSLKMILEGIADSWSKSIDKDNYGKRIRTDPKELEKQLSDTENIIKAYNKLTRMTGQEDPWAGPSQWGPKVDFQKANAAFNEYKNKYIAYIFEYGGEDAFKEQMGTPDKMDKWARNLRIRLNAVNKTATPVQEKKKPPTPDLLKPQFDAEGFLKEFDTTDWDDHFKNPFKGKEDPFKDYKVWLANFNDELLQIEDDRNQKRLEAEKEAHKLIVDSYWSMGESITSIYETIAMKKLQIQIDNAEKEKQVIEERFETESRLASGSAFRREMAEQRKAKAILEADKKIEEAKKAMDKRQRAIDSAKATADVFKAVIGTIAETHGNAAVRLASGAMVAGIVGSYLAQLVAINYRDGGLVTGNGNGTSDSVSANLSAGEWVLSKRDVARLGGPAGVQQVIDRGTSYTNNSNSNVYINTVIGTKQFIRENIVPELRKELAR